MDRQSILTNDNPALDQADAAIADLMRSVPGGDAGTAPLHPDVTRAFCQLWMLALCERLEPGAQAGIGRILSAAWPELTPGTVRWLSTLPAQCADTVRRPAGERAQIRAHWGNTFLAVRAACAYGNAPAMLRDVLNAVEPSRPGVPRPTRPPPGPRCRAAAATRCGPATRR